MNKIKHIIAAPLNWLHKFRTNHLFLTAAEARRACLATYNEGISTSKNSFSKAVLDITQYRAKRIGAKKYEITTIVDAATLGTAAGNAEQSPVASTITTNGADCFCDGAATGKLVDLLTEHPA